MNKIVKEILRAQVYQVAKETPLENAHVLSNKHTNTILIKREDLQQVHSFKIRGAFNKINKLSLQEKSKGIISVSAGNHAQGVAMSAQYLNIKSTIVMPITTPDIKVNAVKSYGANVILFGDNYDDATKYCLQLVKEHGLTLIHPFDDEDVMAGQGTIAVEILRQHSRHIDAVFVPIGGGGLIAGISAYFNEVSPNTKIIGVEPIDAASMSESLKNDEITALNRVGLFADGVAVKKVSEKTFSIVKKTVKEIMLVSVDETCAAIKDIFEDNRSVAEPAGAIGLAGMKQYIKKYQLTNKTLVVIESGSNINFDRLRHVAERADIGEQKEILFSVCIPETPGSFKSFCSLLGKQQITEFNYRYSDSKLAQVFVGLSNPKKNKKDIFNKIEMTGLKVVDFSDNEMAKQHVRYMVGGHSVTKDKEVVYRFEFPERPGALMDFLIEIGETWNISLFHYRNHGAAYGRVLVGLEVPSNEIDDLEKSFNLLKFNYKKETDNSAYKLFLS